MNHFNVVGKLLRSEPCSLGWWAVMVVRWLHYPFSIKANMNIITLCVKSVASHLISRFFLFSVFLAFIVVIVLHFVLHRLIFITHTVYRAFDRLLATTTMQCMTGLHCIDLKSFCNAPFCVCQRGFGHVFSTRDEWNTSLLLHIRRTCIYAYHFPFACPCFLIISQSVNCNLTRSQVSR